MPPHDLLSLQLFAAVVELRNIAAAARANNIAPSAVSKRISDLEARIGAALLYRLHDGVAATPAGEALYGHAKRIERILADADAELSEFARGARGHIRLWSNWSAIAQFLPDDLALYAQAHPDVRIELKVDVSHAIVEAVISGDADVGIYSDDIGPTTLCERVYRRDRLVVVAPRGHALEGRASVTLAEVAAHPIVSLGGQSSLKARLVLEAEKLGAPLRVKIEVLDFDAVRGLVSAGLGVSVLPQGAVEPYLGGELAIVAIPLDEPWAVRSLMVGVRSPEGVSLSARQLIDCIAPPLEPASVP